MRLKEPLYGLHIAQMHFVIHLSLAICMIYMHTKLPQKDLSDIYFNDHGIWKIKQECRKYGEPKHHDVVDNLPETRHLAAFSPIDFYKELYIHLTEKETNY